MTKGSAEEQVDMYRKLLGERNADLEEEADKVFNDTTSSEVVATPASTETALVEYRDQMVARIVDTTENALYAAYDAHATSRNNDDAAAILPSTEMRARLTRFVGFLLKEGAVYPLDLTRFLTMGPNPRRICLLPEDRLFEVTATLVDVGLRDTALLSVMFHEDLRVFAHPVSKIHQSLEFLRQEGVALSETLSTILIDCPSLIADLDQDDWRQRKDWFDHHFTTRSFREFLITQPAVLLEPLRDIEEKFFYVYTEMGVDQKQMMECFVFMHTIDHIKCRHEFLRRCGFYKFPDPKKRVINLNPHLRKIFDWSETKFISLVPGFLLKDYRIFKRIYLQELDDALAEIEDEAEEDPELAEREAEARKRREELGANPEGFFMPGKKFRRQMMRRAFSDDD